VSRHRQTNVSPGETLTGLRPLTNEGIKPSSHGQCYGWERAEGQPVLPVRKSIFQMPKLRAIRIDLHIQALLIAELVGFPRDFAFLTAVSAKDILGASLSGVSGNVPSRGWLSSLVCGCHRASNNRVRFLSFNVKRYTMPR
jgi:hypothetical protein